MRQAQHPLGAGRRLLRSLALVVLVSGTLSGVSAALAQASATPPLAAPAASPVLFQPFALPGPLQGVVARVDLKDPRVGVILVMASGGRPDQRSGPPDCAGHLEVPSALARTHDLAVAVNASFFAAAPQDIGGRQVTYFVGNCATPVGWHYSAGRLRTRPTQARMKATLLVHTSRRLSLHANLEELPADVAYAVSGNAMVLESGRPLAEGKDSLRHPRTAVGLSRDGNTLLLVVVDGRQEGRSRGATLAELGALLKSLGAHDGINLDGGGSSAMVIKDRSTGVFAVANRPSGLAVEAPGVPVERPVVDVLGVVLRDPPQRPTHPVEKAERRATP